MTTLQFKRPPGETWIESCRAISGELKEKGIRPSTISTLWITDDEGKTIYNVKVK